jgi:hypothetical protein
VITNGGKDKIINVIGNDLSARNPVIGFIITRANLLNSEMDDRIVALFSEGMK